MKNLTIQTVLGFLALILVLGLCIFLPPMTLNYPQGWIYICVFAGSVILITGYLFKYDKKLLERRVKAGATSEKEKSQKTIQLLASLFFLLPYVFSAFDYKYHWSLVSLNLSLIADFFVALGFYIVFLVFKENTFTSAIIEVNENQKVISTGPYKAVRHPMYSGALMMMLFTPVALGSFWGVLFVLPLIAAIIARLLDEEKFLSKNLAGYREYCNKVRYHLIPYIW